MVHVDLQRWELTPELLLALLLETPCPRTRERLWALQQIAMGSCASRLTQMLGRHLGTVLKWVHDFNRGGLPALCYRHSGGRRRERTQFAGLVDEALRTAVEQAAQRKKAHRRKGRTGGARAGCWERGAAAAARGAMDPAQALHPSRLRRRPHARQRDGAPRGQGPGVLVEKSP